MKSTLASFLSCKVLVAGAETSSRVYRACEEAMTAFSYVPPTL